MTEKYTNTRFEELEKIQLRDTDLKEDKYKQMTDKHRTMILEHWQNKVRIFIIGAGGLGCELLKNFAMLGIKNIDIVDLDTIEVTNLNRQFQFRQKDVGRAKAEVAAEFVKSRVQDCTINWHNKKIQEFEDAELQKFDIFVAGLDNIEARRWLNAKVHSMTQFKDGKPNLRTRKCIIDGGTEAFNGQARIIIPYETACYECTLSLMPKAQDTFQLCTIANTPRSPEHCIAYIMMITWWEQFGGDENKHLSRKYDTDSYDDMNWIYERALARAKEYGIEGVTYENTLGFVKKIVPAIASTNSKIAGSCASECLKFLTGCNLPVDNWYASYQQNQINESTQKMERVEGCIVCNLDGVDLEVSRGITVQKFVEILEEKVGYKDQTIVTNKGQYFYAANPPTIRETTLANLEKKIGDLLDTGKITDSARINVYCKGGAKDFIFIPTYVD